jgi:hypothetical protein
MPIFTKIVEVNDQYIKVATIKGKTYHGTIMNEIELFYIVSRYDGNRKQTILIWIKRPFL